MKKIHINPQSKGSLGKSFETECRVSWLDRCGIPWYGFDLDDRHAQFYNRHPDKVKLLSLEDGAKDTILQMMQAVITRPEPVVIIDCRAQADLLIRESFDSLSISDYAKHNDAEFVISLFPSNDDESLNNLGAIIKWAANKAQFVVVRNPALAKALIYDESQMKGTLLNKLGAVEVIIPHVTEFSLKVLEETERRAGRAIPFIEFARGFGDMGAGAKMIVPMEFAWVLGSMDAQYSKYSSLLVPEEYQLKQRTSNAVKAQKPNEEFNLSL